MMDFQKEALQIKDEIITNRRTIHHFAETAFDLPQTVDFVMKKLQEYGLEPKRVGKAGVSCLIGKPAGKTILLRADMDALPMAEETGLAFAAENGNCHSCGHDCHTAMLLGAAKILKAHEAELQGSVKLMFQPAEEKLAGALDMIANGILENPKVDAAMGLHITVGGGDTCKPGVLSYRSGDASYSGDCIRITVKGKNAHGSTPQLGVDAISAAAHIILALQEIPAREISMESKDVVLVGMIQGGSSCNTVSGECVMEASVRSDSREGRAFLKKRVKEIAQSIAQAYRAEAEVEYVYGMPGLYCDPQVTKTLSGYLEEMNGKDKVVQMYDMSGTEDFTMVAEQVPSAFFMLGVGSVAEGYHCGAHHPAMILDENALPVGTAAYCCTAMRFLEENAKA